MALQESAGDRAGEHAEPGHDLHHPLTVLVAEQPAAETAPKTGKCPRHVRKPDRQPLDMFDRRIDQAHGEHDAVEIAGPRHKGPETGAEHQHEADRREHADDAEARGHDHAKCVADDERPERADEQQGADKIAIAEGDRCPGRVAAHEGDEVANAQEPDRVGHAGEERDRRGNGKRRAGALTFDQPSPSPNGHLPCPRSGTRFSALRP
ncbi:hypothetical protein D9M72_510120 [compost metagenome]